LVTSAAKATHSAPDCRAIATVSSAEARLLSTAEHLGPFLDEPHHRGAAVAHAFAR
jgi:hypothetical protein